MLLEQEEDRKPPRNGTKPTVRATIPRKRAFSVNSVVRGRPARRRLQLRGALPPGGSALHAHHRRGTKTRLIYATPNLVVELLSIDSSGSETVAAKFLVDVIDRDLSLRFREGGAPSLDTTWESRQSCRSPRRSCRDATPPFPAAAATSTSGGSSAASLVPLWMRRCSSSSRPLRRSSFSTRGRRATSRAS